MAPDPCFTFGSDNSELKQTLRGSIYLDDAIVIGGCGLRDFVQSGNELAKSPQEWNNGAYIGIFDAGSHWYVRTDVFGQELLYLYQNKTDWVISNSIYSLYKYASKRGWKVTHDLVGVHSMGSSAWSVQPVVHRTIFKEVQLLQSNQYILIDKTTKEVEVLEWPYSEVFSIRESSTFQEQIEKGINFSLSIINAYLNLSPNFKVICQLSGGFDSRTCFGLLNKIPLEGKNVGIQSNKNSPSEIEIARRAAGVYGFKVNDFNLRDRRYCSADAAYSAWKYSSLGSYVPIYFPVYADSEFGIKVKGDLPISAHAGFYGRTFNGFIGRFSSFLSDSPAKDDIVNSLKKFERDFVADGYSSDNARAFLYSCFRSRFHGGRRWIHEVDKLGPVYTPLMNVNFMRALLYAQKEGLSMHDFKSNLLLAVSHRLSEVPFSDEEKNIDPSIVKSSYFAREVVPAIKPVRMFFDEREIRKPKFQQAEKRPGKDDFIERLWADFQYSKPYLLELEWFDKTLIDKAEVEFEESKTLSHHFRATVLCLNAAFSCGLLYEQSA